MEFINKKPHIILISGKARSGKDTTADYIKSYYLNENKHVLRLGMVSPLVEYCKNITSWDGKEETKPRTLMQEVGTTLIRNKIDEYFFIKRLIADIEVYSYYIDVITVPDIRMIEEMTEIKKSFENVITINLKRSDFQDGLTKKEQGHITETALDNYKNYDYIIKNDGTLEDLKEKIYEILKVI